MSEPLTDVRDMRKALTMAAARGDRIDGAPPRPNEMPLGFHLPRTAHNLAQFNGWSGEDQMTWLAYQAMLALEKAYDRELQMLNLTAAPAVFFTQGQPEQTR